MKPWMKIVIILLLILMIILALFALGRTVEAIVLASAIGTGIGSKQVIDKIVKLNKVQSDIDKQVEDIQTTKEELNSIESGVEDAEESYYVDIKSMSREEKKSLAEKLFNKDK